MLVFHKKNKTEQPNVLFFVSSLAVSLLAVPLIAEAPSLEAEPAGDVP